MAMDDFEDESKSELSQMIECYVSKYFTLGLNFYPLHPKPLTLGLYYSNEYEFMQDLDEIGKERIKVMSSQIIT